MAISSHKQSVVFVCAGKAGLREALDWIQKNVPAPKQRDNLIGNHHSSPAHSSKSQYLKFHYFSKEEAATPHFRSMLRDPHVCTKQPEPDVAAAVIDCDAFHPQIQAILCKCGAAAAEHERNISEATGDSLENCKCRAHYGSPMAPASTKTGISSRSMRGSSVGHICARPVSGTKVSYAALALSSRNCTTR